MKNKTILLIGIIFLASILRLWKLGQVPISPDWDEAALGYNAYSLMLTGRDEFGKFLPIVLQSFNDYKPALYAYLIIPFIKLFGLSVFTVRLPSALFGILSVLASFYLVKELFPSGFTNSAKKISSDTLALLVSLFFAVSPWHIQFSRIAFESNVGLAFNIFGILFFIKGVKRNVLFLLSAFCFSMSVYVYQSEKVFVPLMLLILIFVYRRQLSTVPKKNLLLAGLALVVLLLPMVFYIGTNKQALARAQGVSIFSKRENAEVDKNINRLAIDSEKHDKLGLLLDNRRTQFMKNIFDGYISHFDPNWLFIKGDPIITRHHAPNMGLLYLWTLPFLLVGIYVLFFSSEKNNVSLQSKMFIFAWLFITPIPASVTYDVPHAVRTLNFLPTWEMSIAFGVVQSYSYATNFKRWIRLLLYFTIGFVVLFNVGYYIDQYFVQQNYYYALDWQYGYKQVVGYIKPIQEKYKKIIVARDGEMSQSYIFFLFYTQYDPRKYLADGGTQQDNLHFANYEFRRFDYDKEDANVLLVGTKGDFGQVYKTIFETYYPNNTLAMKVVEKDKK